MHNPKDTSKDYDVEPSELIGKRFKSDDLNSKQETDKNRESVLEDLASRLESELKDTNMHSSFDARNEKEQDEKSKEIMELEKEIEDLEDNLLPDQNLDPERELESGDDSLLPLADQTLIEEKWEDQLDEQKDKEIEDKEIEEKKNQAKEKKAKRKQIDKLMAAEEKRQQEVEQRQIRELEKHKQKVAKVFAFQEIKSQRNLVKQARPRLSLGWYISLIKKPVIYLAGIEMLVYFFSLVPSFKINFFNLSLAIILLVDVIVLGWLVVKVLKTKVQTHWVGIKTVVLAGVFVGLFRAVFKLIWLNIPWTVPNIIIEPLMMAGVGLVVGVVVGVIVKNKK